MIYRANRERELLSQSWYKFMLQMRAMEGGGGELNCPVGIFSAYWMLTIRQQSLVYWRLLTSALPAAFTPAHESEHHCSDEDGVRLRHGDQFPTAEQLSTSQAGLPQV